MPIKFIFLIIVSMLFVNSSLAQDCNIQFNNSVLCSIQKTEFAIKNHHFKITFSDPWLSRDKAHHFMTSAFLSGIGYYFFHEEQTCSNNFSQHGGFGFSISLGLAKEVQDGFKPQNAFSVKDLIADILGALAGIAMASDL